jgi:ribosomal protein S18 acetylase RimI-like enzyme
VSELVRAPVRVFYLEMAEPAALRPARDPGPDVAVSPAAVPLGALNRFFYAEVGREHHWVDRADWGPERWQAAAERVETWLVADRGTPAGYAELGPRPDGGVEIEYFGILPAFQGHGLGGHLLTAVTRRAWARVTGRGVVGVNTCELDGAGALANYRARGFTVVREATEDRWRPA